VCYNLNIKMLTKGKTTTKCNYCGLRFETWNCRLKQGTSKYCSRNCVIKAKSGQGHWHWNGGGLVSKCVVCRKEFQCYPDKRRSERKFCSKECLNKWQETSLRGKDNPNWKGGISTENNLIRTSREYEDWKTMIFERDNYTCVRCVKRGGDLNAHHIIPFSIAPEERLKLSNGATLCIPCHDWIYSNELSA